nr:MAG TPA: hypothetical protein [Bacteriophage sp.]
MKIPEPNKHLLTTSKGIILLHQPSVPYQAICLLDTFLFPRNPVQNYQ